MKKIKLLALMLIVLQCASLFVGCQKSDVASDGLTEVKVWSVNRNDKLFMDNLVAEYNKNQGKKDGIKIVYEVKDNISSDIVVNILLDDKIYDKSMLIDGNHCLFIEAIDEAGNVSQIKYNFVISKDSYIEEVLNHNLKLKSGVIIGFVLLSCLLIVFAKIKITMRYKNVTKEK